MVILSSVNTDSKYMAYRSFRYEKLAATGARQRPRGSLACDGQTFIATLLFDPSMSALPIIETQKSQSVGLFNRQ